MVLLRSCFSLIADCFKPCKPSDNDDFVEVSERTPLFMLSPAAAETGFSGGFHSFVESRGGVTFGLSNLALYYLVSVIAFSLVFERWTIVDSIYYATVVFTTIGYGDVTPSTDAGRLFTVFFSLYGIVILGFFAGIIGEKIVEFHNEAIEAMEHRARGRVKSMFGVAQSQEKEEQSQRTGWTVLCEMVELELPIIAIIVVIGIIYGTSCEGWTVIQSIYFTSITSSTVGFGDFHPTHEWSRVVCLLFLPLAVAVFCEALGRIAGGYLDYKIRIQEQKFLSRQLTKADLDHMDANKDGVVQWGEFLSFMLLAMQKVNEGDIAELREVFDKLDRNQTGVLNKEDIQGFVRENTARNIDS